MRILFDGDAHVDYAQIYVRPGWEAFEDPLTGNFRGQVNGLCGAAEPGHLYMITGLHTGHVGFTVELHVEAPPIEDSWEEVVEASFRPTSETVALTEWGGESWPLALERMDYRVRYSASGMDQARQVDTRLEDEPILDRYLLQFWPAPPSADRVLKQTSAVAAYWHDRARQLPAPPTPEEVAEAERRRAEAERQEELEATERMKRVEDDLSWGEFDRVSASEHCRPT